MDLTKIVLFLNCATKFTKDKRKKKMKMMNRKSMQKNYKNTLNL